MQLGKIGSDKTGEQCRAKIKKLKLEYRKEKDKHNKTGHGRSTWRFFDDLDAVLCNRPTSQPTVILDTSAPSTIDSDVEQLEDVSDETEESHTTQEESMPNMPGDTSARTPSTPGEFEKPEVHPAKGKRKQTKEDKVEAIMTSVVKEIVTVQKESDNFLEHEEKRMKVEAEQRRAESVPVTMDVNAVWWPRRQPSNSTVCFSTT